MNKLIVENNPEWFKLKKEEQPKEKDTFVWSDELVKEFVISFNKIDKLITGIDPIGKTISEWKQSKSTPKEDKIKVEGLFLSGPPHKDTVYVLHLNKLLNEKDLPEIKKAIEGVLNNDGKENFKNYL